MITIILSEFQKIKEDSAPNWLNLHGVAAQPEQFAELYCTVECLPETTESHVRSQNKIEYIIPDLQVCPEPHQNNHHSK